MSSQVFIIKCFVTYTFVINNICYVSHKSKCEKGTVFKAWSPNCVYRMITVIEAFVRQKGNNYIVSSLLGILIFFNKMCDCHRKNMNLDFILNNFFLPKLQCSKILSDIRRIVGDLTVGHRLLTSVVTLQVKQEL